MGDWVSFDVDDDVIYCPVMQRTLSGITAVKDTFTATGTEEIQENANSMENRIASVEATARGTGNYFWVDDDGAHVTQVPKSDIVADGWTGIYNSLVTSTDFQVRYGETPLATFGEEVTLGNEGDSVLHLTNDSISGSGANDKFFFEFNGDGAAKQRGYGYTDETTTADDQEHRNLRVSIPAFGTNSGQANVRMVFWASGRIVEIIDFGYITYGTSAALSGNITIDNVPYYYNAYYSVSSGSVSTGYITFPSSVDTVRLYVDFSNTETTPTYVLGGECTATGSYSYAGGCEVTNNWDYAFAHGYGLSTSRMYQAVFGRYNEGDSNNVIEVGNGTSSSSPYNAFNVTSSGKAYANGNLLPQLMSTTISGTTSTSANISTGITISTGVVVGFQSDASNSYAFIPFCRSDGTWYLHVMQANASQAALASTAVSGTVYYLAF